MRNYLKYFDESGIAPDGKSNTYSSDASNNKQKQTKLFISKNKHILSFKFDDFSMYPSMYPI